MPPPPPVVLCSTAPPPPLRYGHGTWTATKHAGPLLARLTSRRILRLPETMLPALRLNIIISLSRLVVALRRHILIVRGSRWPGRLLTKVPGNVVRTVLEAFDAIELLITTTLVP